MKAEAALGHREFHEKTDKNAGVGESIWTRRVEDYLRHVKDLQNKYYEGAVSRADREALFMKAFDFTTPVARRVLDDLNVNFLKGTGDSTVQRPTSDGEGGLIGSWSLVWPLLHRAVSRFDGKPLEPLAVTAIFPLKTSGAMPWTHPHLALRRPGIDGWTGGGLPLPSDIARGRGAPGTHHACPRRSGISSAVLPVRSELAPSSVCGRIIGVFRRFQTSGRRLVLIVCIRH